VFATKKFVETWRRWMW